MTTPTLSPAISEKRLSLLPAAIKSDIDAELFDGAVVVVARRGEVILHEAIGYADRSAARPMQLDSVFVTLSMFKTMTNAAVLQFIDRGRMSFTTQVREIIPEYAVNGKGNTTVADLLLHKAGLPLWGGTSARSIGGHPGDHCRCVQDGSAVGSWDGCQLFSGVRTECPR